MHPGKAKRDYPKHINQPPRKSLDELRVQTAYKLPPELLREFRMVTRRMGVSMTTVVEEGISRWLKENR